MDEGWTFTQDGIATVITEINCDLFILTSDPCGTCTLEQVQLTNSTITPTATGPTENPEDGCLILVVTCGVGNLGVVFMQFNGGIGGPAGISEGISVTLNCVNGVWEYNEDGTDITIDSVQCIGE